MGCGCNGSSDMMEQRMKGKMLNKVRLTYFPAHFRADPARFMLSHANVDFEDNVIHSQVFKQKKMSFMGGSLPAFELKDGTMLGQSLAITRLIARKNNYYPADP